MEYQTYLCSSTTQKMELLRNQCSSKTFTKLSTQWILRVQGYCVLNYVLTVLVTECSFHEILILSTQIIALFCGCLVLEYSITPTLSENYALKESHLELSDISSPKIAFDLELLQNLEINIQLLHEVLFSVLWQEFHLKGMI